MSTIEELIHAVGLNLISDSEEFEQLMHIFYQ